VVPSRTRVLTPFREVAGDSSGSAGSPCGTGVGFVNSVAPDFQGNPEPVVSGVFAPLTIAADKGERFERVRERLPVISPCPSPFAAFLAEQMLTSSRARPFGGSGLPLKIISAKGGASVASVTAPPIR
jgi:hypothetical protein